MRSNWLAMIASARGVGASRSRRVIQSETLDSSTRDSRTRRLLHFQQQSFGVLDALLDAHQEADRLAAVDQAVVVGQRQVHHRTDDDLVLDDDGALLDGVHAQ